MLVRLLLASRISPRAVGEQQVLLDPLQRLAGIWHFARSVFAASQLFAFFCLPSPFSARPHRAAVLHGPLFVQRGGACQPAPPAALAPPPTPTLGLVAETGLAERLLESEVEVLRDRGSEQATEEGSKRLTAGMPSIKSNLYEIMRRFVDALCGDAGLFWNSGPSPPYAPTAPPTAAFGPSAMCSSTPPLPPKGEPKEPPAPLAFDLSSPFKRRKAEFPAPHAAQGGQWSPQVHPRPNNEISINFLTNQLPPPARPSSARTRSLKAGNQVATGVAVGCCGDCRLSALWIRISTPAAPAIPLPPTSSTSTSYHIVSER